MTAGSVIARSGAARRFKALRYLTKEGIGPWSDVREIVVP
jgi:hypothetical protein